MFACFIYSRYSFNGLIVFRRMYAERRENVTASNNRGIDLFSSFLFVRDLNDLVETRSQCEISSYFYVHLVMVRDFLSQHSD